MYTQKRRTLIIITISVLMNFVYFLIAYYLKLPLWLDTTGTIYASILLGFPAGFIVAIVNNVSQAVLFYGADSLSFYFVSAVTALVSGAIMKKFKQRKVLRWLVLFVGILFTGVCFAVGITFVADAGIPSDFWGQRLYYDFLERGVVNDLATIYAVVIVKVMDVVATVGIVIFSYMFTPKVLRHEDYAVA